MVEKTEQIFREINAKLSALITLGLSGKPKTTKEKIKLLVNVGISNKGIAEILGISEKYVSKEKSLIKRYRK